MPLEIINVSAHDREILRRLAARKAEITMAAAEKHG
jgi:hypothetical protein